MPKATINVVDTQTGLKRTATTNGTGQFRVVGLSPATYNVSAQMSGFATEIRRSVTVAIGQTVTSDFRMKPSQVATVIEVT
ncbi:MAG: carboxypeptidase-like regulatory domain-containing protein, partial [Candidatus Sulfotelmatobacter sp.]